MGTIAQELQRIQTAKSDLKTAIEAKGVTVPSATTIDGYATLVGQIQTGATEAAENDVNFYDYDGFRVASFTIAEAKALTQAQYDAILPPTHEGLTFQEWNWTLNDITTYDRQYADIGANYITTDGKTHIFIQVEAGYTFKLEFEKENNVAYEVSWGDGSQNETQSRGTTASFSHTYTNTGFYEVTILPDENDTTGFRITTSLIKAYKILTGRGFYISNSTCFGEISVHKDSADTSYIANNRLYNLNYSFIALPRGTYSTNTTNFKYISYGVVCFPKTVKSICGTRWMMGNRSQTRLVVPNTETSSNKIKNDSVNDMRQLRIISIPNIELDNSNPFNGDSFLEYIDIVQGWTPNMNLTLSGSTAWSEQNIVRFFNKLGTTTNTITLTFGSTNLDKLTNDEKAIATNKGYTLA